MENLKNDDKARRLVISDIHGCNLTFKKLLTKIELSKNDDLYLLGDYIDRGPDSAGVIDTIIDLKSSGFKVYTLIGNHEHNILQAFKEYDRGTFVHFVSKINKSGSLLEADGAIKAKYLEFLSSLNDYYFDLNNCLLVHAGFNFKHAHPFEDKISMIEQRRTIPDKSILGDKYIVHGHNVTYMKDIVSAIQLREQVIPLDNGCVYSGKHKIYDTAQTGQLCCLNVDSFELIIQSNIEHTSEHKLPDKNLDK